MKLKNTSRYSDAEVRVLVRFALAAVGGVAETGEVAEVAVRNRADAFSGHAYSGRRVTVSVGAPETFPTQAHYADRGERFPSYELRDYREALVVVAAHEFTHLAQFEGRRQRIAALHQRGEFEAAKTIRAERHSTRELQCEIAAVRALEAFRAARAEVDAEIAAAVAAEVGRAEARRARGAAARSPEAKLKAIRGLQVKWERKLKMARTKLRKLAMRARYYEKRAAIKRVEP